MTIRASAAKTVAVFAAVTAVTALADIRAATPLAAQAASAQLYDLVLEGGRVMDPETGTDAVLNVGILDGSVAALTSAPLRGREVVDVSGHVVAPGFVDLHAHGQDPFSRDLQARDGVTTALELESGVWPVDEWYAEREGSWRINFGATTSYGAARALAFDGDERAAVYEAATDGQVAEMQGSVALGLAQGAIGVGIGLQYIPGASRAEIFRTFQTAAERGLTVFVHIRYGGLVEPESSISAVQEMIADAAGSGGSVHIVHIGSSGLLQIPMLIDMIQTAHDGGVDVTTEVYPYTASQTLIESALVDDWESWGDARFTRYEWVRTGERLTRETFARYRAEGGSMIVHSRTESTTLIGITSPITMFASDGALGHPRGAGTFGKILGRYVREQGALDLMDALSRMTIRPARRLEPFVPAIANKGRIRVGADADLTIFDPATVIDRATYAHPMRTSEGFEYVLVNGVVVIDRGTLVEGVRPGRPVTGRPTY